IPYMVKMSMSDSGNTFAASNRSSSSPTMFLCSDCYVTVRDTVSRKKEYHCEKQPKDSRCYCCKSDSDCGALV
ncbi:hypothetical protein BDV33DRAFT_184511, partial [Aspergillus novoparasiticus]